jgi:hypothetical protein
MLKNDFIKTLCEIYKQYGLYYKKRRGEAIITNG